MKKRGANRQEKAARRKPSEMVAPEQWPAWIVEKRRISELSDHPRNVRIHPVSQLKQLDQSFAEHGAVRPMVINEAGQILAGHGSRDSLLHLHGDIEVPVVVTRGWSDEQQRAFMLRDNALAELSSWDKPRLGIELADLKAMRVADIKGIKFPDILNLGFKPATLNKLLTGVGEQPGNGGPNADVVPEAPAEAVSRLGDIWMLGEHRIMCGDATNPDHVACLMAGDMPRACVTDPPYGISFERGKFIGRDQATPNTFAPIANDDLQGEQLAAFVCAALRAAFAEAVGISAYVWSAPLREGYATFAGVERAGFNVQSQIVWRKSSFLMGRGDHHWQHEVCWYCNKGGSHAWYGGRDQGTVWDYPKPQSVDREGHPTPKPVALFEQCIGNITTPGDYVYDPFSGSGTTIIAAEPLGRRALVMELEPRYIDVAVKRWESFTKKTACLAVGEKTWDQVAISRKEAR